MAEILGVVSGGAGIISLAAQLLTSAQALKGFIAKAQKARLRLRTLACEIETLGLMLKEFEIAPRQTNETVDVVLDRCVTSVQSEARVIVQHVERLENKLRRSPLRGKVCTAFEDPEIETSLDGLERAKTSLLHAHLMYMDCKRSHVNNENQKALIDRLDELLTNSISSRNHVTAATILGRDGLHREALICSCEPYTRSTPGSYEEHSATNMSLTRPTRTKTTLTQQRFSITLRSSLSRYVCTLMMSHATLLPSLSLRTWIQGSTSPAFTYCQDGDIVGLRRMLSDGHVRPRDRDLGNFTLLGIATMAGNIDTCLLLMNQFGLRNDFEAINEAMTVLAINPGLWTGRLAQYKDMFQFMLEKSIIDYDIDEESQRVDAVPDWLFACPDTATLEMILRNQLVLNPKTPLFRPDQLLDLDDSYVYRLENPEVLLTLFNIEWSFRGLTKLPFEVQRQMLHLIAKKIGVQYFHCSSHWHVSEMPWSQSRWLGLVRDLFKVGVEPTAILDGRTPLLCMWRFSTHRWDQYPGTLYEQDRMSAIFDCWIQTILDAGVDLLEYTQREQQAWSILKTEWCSEKASSHPSLLFRPYQVERMISGPRPTDCSFTARRQKIFHIWQEPEMPGSWLSSIRDPVGNVLVTLEDESPGSHLQRVRSITTLSEPVDIRCFQERDRMRDVRLCATLEKTQDDSGPLALRNLWRENNHRRTARRRSRSTPPREFRSQQVNKRWTPGCRTRSLIHHLWPITMFENSPLIEEHGPCQCFQFPIPEFHECRPYWYRVVCIEEQQGLRSKDRDVFYRTRNED